MSIKPLSKQTIKLINSSQVISSIYSAIKELVENSLDAQAQNIEVNLVDNGLSLIEVKDNGTGVSKEDAPFMALPAYTSKITDFNDLDLLKTYGFRGEGLSAVCQVSDVTVCTKTEDDETMTRYVFDNEGKVVKSELTHGSRGTTVQMRNLFKHFPVRRNILNTKKRISQEIKAIETLLKAYSICQPSIRFTFRVNSNTVFTKLSCKNVTEALKTVVGMQTFSKLTYTKKCFTKTELQLFVPKKETTDCTEISQTGYQFLCVNNRPIKSKDIEKQINKRILQYFSQNTSSSRKFIFCLMLTVDPSLLDVNLEPNKDKVFLQNEATVLKEIDELLLNLYELQDSQISTQGDIVNGVSDMNIDASEKEKEWPACKKRKLDSQNENVCSINVNAANGTKSVTDKSFKKSDNEFLSGINEPMLSDSDSNDAENCNKKNKNQHKNEVQMMEVPEFGSSELFDIVQENLIKDHAVEESLSQLPKVDLGEDFDWLEITSRSKTTSISNQEPNSDGSANLISHDIDEVAWSKGQVPGLQGGVVVSNHDGANGVTHNEIKLKGKEADNEESESFDFGKNIEIIDDDRAPISDGNDINPIEIDEFNWELNLNNTKRKTPTKRNNDKIPSTSSRSSKKRHDILTDPKQTRIPFAGDNACLNSTAPSAFAMFCADARSKILKKHPDLNPPEVAACLNRQWMEISSEEREYYRDRANQYIKTTSNKSLSQTSRKTKPELPESEKEKNRKQLLSMLGNMKTNKAEVKNESMIMRSFAPWNINLSFVTEKFRNPPNRPVQSIVGSLNSLVWILHLDLKLLVFDITELHAQFNIEGYDINQINAEYVQNIVDRWFVEKNDMSVFHPFYSIKT